MQIVFNPTTKRITSVDPDLAGLLGYGDKEMRQRRLLDFVHPSERISFIENFDGKETRRVTLRTSSFRGLKLDATLPATGTLEFELPGGAKIETEASVAQVNRMSALAKIGKQKVGDILASVQAGEVDAHEMLAYEQSLASPRKSLVDGLNGLIRDAEGTEEDDDEADA